MRFDDTNPAKEKEDFEKASISSKFNFIWIDYWLPWEL